MKNTTRFHATKNVSDPSAGKWVRKNFPGSVLNENDKEPRQRAELETDMDLEKPIEQLLCDFHEQQSKKPKTDNLEESILDINLHAQKRMVSMMAKVAISNDRMSRIMLRISVAALAVSFSALVCAILALWK